LLAVENTTGSSSTPTALPLKQQQQQDQTKRSVPSVSPGEGLNVHPRYLLGSTSSSLPPAENMRHVQFEGNSSQGQMIAGTQGSAMTQQYKATATPNVRSAIRKTTTKGSSTGSGNGYKPKKTAMVTVGVQTDIQDINETLYVGSERSISNPLLAKFTAVYAPYFLQPPDVTSSNEDGPIKLISLYNLLHAKVPDLSIVNLGHAHLNKAISRLSEQMTVGATARDESLD